MVVVWPHSGAIPSRPSGTGAAAWYWYGHTLELSNLDHQVQEQLQGGGGMATSWIYPTQTIRYPGTVGLLLFLVNVANGGSGSRHYLY